MSVVINWHGCNLFIGGYAGVLCGSLLEVTPQNLHQAISLFRQSEEGGWEQFRIDGLFLNGKDFGELSWLREFPNLRNLYVDSSGTKLKDLSEIQRLSNIRQLGFSDTNLGQLDFDFFPELTNYSGAWSKSYKNLAKCPNLDQLHLHNYAPESEDLAELGSLYKLRTLTLLKPKLRSSIGIGGLEDLSHFGLYSAKTLTFLTELENLESLRSIEIEKCSAITNLSAIANVPRLRKLMLSDLGEIESLGFISKMKCLEFISFVGTRIKDGDLSILVDHPRLRYAGFFDAKHYSHSSREVKEIHEGRSA